LLVSKILKVVKDSAEIFFRNRDGSLGIAEGWATGVRFPAGPREYLLHRTQTVSQDHRSPSSTVEVVYGGAMPLSLYLTHLKMAM
jgi:hypothetical protein